MKKEVKTPTIKDVIIAVAKTENRLMQSLHKTEIRLEKKIVASVGESEIRLKGEITKTLDGRIDEVLEAMNEFATSVDQRFDRVDQRFTQVDSRLDGVETRLSGVETRLTGVETRLSGVETRLTGVEVSMVTKDYLDDKLANLRADLVILARKGNQKLTELIEGLVKKGSLTRDVAMRILSMEPFPN